MVKNPKATTLIYILHMVDIEIQYKFPLYFLFLFLHSHLREIDGIENKKKVSNDFVS